MGILKISAVVFLIRILYVIADVYYNSVILDASSSMNLYLDPEPFDRLAELGHILASVGTALLFAYPLYRLVKNYISKLSGRIAFFMIFGLVFYGAYYSYTKLIDKVVEWKKGESYDAYYLNLFRLEKLAGASGQYSDFFNVDDNQDDKLTPDEKILLTNIVILKWAEKSLVEEVREDDKALVELFKKTMEDKKNISKRFNRLGNAEKFFAAYSAMSRELVNADASAKKAYGAMKNELPKKYNTYLKQRERMYKEGNKRIENIGSYYSDLETYFEYRGYPEAERKYKRKMHKEFGRYIVPETWCSGNQCPSRKAIREVIIKEAEARWDRETSGVSLNLNTYEEFAQDAGVRRGLVKELRKRGLNVPDGYALDEATFNKAYKTVLANKYAAFCNKYLGCRIEPGLSYDKYAMTPPVKNGKVKNISISDKEMNTYVSYLKNLQFDDISKIAASSKVKLTKEDFGQDPDSKEMGKRAIKALYIPPIALLFSAFCVIGNGIALLLTLINKIIQWKSKEIPWKGIEWKERQAGFIGWIKWVIENLIFIIKNLILFSWVKWLIESFGLVIRNLNYKRIVVNLLIVTITLAVLSAGVSPLLDNAYLQEKRERHKIMYFVFDRFVKMESMIYQGGLYARMAGGRTVFNAVNSTFGI